MCVRGEQISVKKEKKKKSAIPIVLIARNLHEKKKRACYSRTFSSISSRKISPSNEAACQWLNHCGGDASGRALGVRQTLVVVTSNGSYRVTSSIFGKKQKKNSLDASFFGTIARNGTPYEVFFHTKCFGEIASFAKMQVGTFYFFLI